MNTAPRYRRVVVKLGTSTITDGGSRPSPPRLLEIVRQMARLHATGVDLAIVSSGAIATGRERLGFPELPKSIPAKQMLAAVGQPLLMAMYEQFFDIYGLTVAQVLLTRADMSHRRRYLNSRNALAALLDRRVIPIVNENDTVATEEIRVGDNDNLSALVANLIEADLLVLLTDQAGLYTADPRYNPQASLVESVPEAEIPESLWQAAGGAERGLGTGGMHTKLQAAVLARRAGAEVIIALGSEPDVLTRLFEGEALGTRFSAQTSALESRKRYILAGPAPTGAIVIDAGALQALHNGSSLLPVGVTGVRPLFERGDTVRVLASNEKEVARGLVNYASAELERIRGHQSAQIESVLGYAYGDEIIHRDNLVLL